MSEGTTNASVPKGDDPDAVSLDAAIELIRIREAKGPRKKKAKKKVAKKKVEEEVTPEEAT